MPTELPAFEVDKAGLAKLLARRGKSFAVSELVSNAWDEDTKQVDVLLEREEDPELLTAAGDPEPEQALYRLVVEDDNPEGFKDLSHAYRLFAESAKKGQADKRGRFNLGEKLVIAACVRAEVATTTGTIRFDGDTRVHHADKRKSGSRFTGWLWLSDAEADEIRRVVNTLLPPHGITTTFNLSDIVQREPLRVFEATLRTEIADDEGRLKPTTRKTKVEVYEPFAGEDAFIYEMGIPIVETGDRFHVNVMQKVPLPTDRDNVPPGYLRDVRVAVLNATHDLLTAEDAKGAWVSNALEDEEIVEDAARAAFHGRFGERAVIYDPTDPEANKIAVEKGFTVVPGGALSREAWKPIKGLGIALPAGQVTPSPKPEDESVKLVNPDHYSKAISNVVEFAAQLGQRLLDAQVRVRIANDPTLPQIATYGPRKGGTEGLLTFNLGRLGYAWFEQVDAKVIDLIIHEFGHHYCSDHLDRAYLNALTNLGGRCVMLALAEPEFFAAYGCEVTYLAPTASAA